MNERMTKRDADEQAMMDCEKCKADWTGKHGKPMADCTALYCRNRLLDRLVAYEDTGLTPEEIKAPFTEDAMINLAAQALGVEADRLRELAEADKDGRVLILPCKLGTKVYRIRYEIADYPDEPDLEIADTWFTPEYRDDIGKTVFLTRAEAERALKEME